MSRRWTSIEFFGDDLSFESGSTRTSKLLIPKHPSNQNFTFSLELLRARPAQAKLRASWNALETLGLKTGMP